MSLVDSRTRALWLFGEQHDSVLPSDRAGNLDDLAEGGNVLPAVVDDTVLGFGREFVAASGTGLEVADSGDDLDLSRELTILSLARLDVDDQDSYGADGVLVRRGNLSFELRFQIRNAATQLVRMYLAWSSSGGTVEDVGVTFTWPAGEELFVAAVREVIDGELQCRYQIGGESKEGSAHDLDVTDSGSSVYVGHGAGSNFFDGVIDYLEIVDEAVSAEELRWIWERMSLDVPSAIAAMKRYVPPGVYSQDPDSVIQRELAIQGQGLGVAKSFARRIREYHLPDVAWGETLKRWEQITGHSPKAGDWLQRRRDRVTSFLGTVQGFHLSSLKTELEELLGLDSANIEILEYDNDLSHDFAGGDPGDQIEGGRGTWDYSGGDANYSASVGVAVFQGTADDSAGWALWPVADPEDVWVAGTAKNLTASGAQFAGLLIGNRATGHWLLFGVKQGGDIGYIVYDADGLGNFQTLEAGAAPANTTFHLRVRCVDPAAGDYELRWGTSAAAADAATPSSISGGPVDAGWAGFVVTTHDGSAQNLAADFDDLLIHAPNGDQRFNWYAYRDPGLAGEYDIEGAHLLIQRVKPAHTHATAITTKNLKCDSADSLVDRGPIGK